MSLIASFSSIRMRESKKEDGADFCRSKSLSGLKHHLGRSFGESPLQYECVVFVPSRVQDGILSMYAEQQVGIRRGFVGEHWKHQSHKSVSLRSAVEVLQQRQINTQLPMQLSLFGVWTGA